jgi:hypothetical protein
MIPENYKLIAIELIWVFYDEQMQMKDKGISLEMIFICSTIKCHKYACTETHSQWKIHARSIIWQQKMSLSFKANGLWNMPRRWSGPMCFAVSGHKLVLCQDTNKNNKFNLAMLV